MLLTHSLHQSLEELLERIITLTHSDYLLDDVLSESFLAEFSLASVEQLHRLDEYLTRLLEDLIFQLIRREEEMKQLQGDLAQLGITNRDKQIVLELLKHLEPVL